MISFTVVDPQRHILLSPLARRSFNLVLFGLVAVPAIVVKFSVGDVTTVPGNAIDARHLPR